jgi:aminomethyltransferase
MSDQLALTPLHAWHVAHRGRMVEFGGWSMPVQYTSIVDEHQATRQAVGLFDISHMGRLAFRGSGAAAFLDRICTRQVIGIGSGKIRYSLVTNEVGGILDDVLIYHLSEASGEPIYYLVVNASNRPKIVGWLERHLPSAPGVQFSDETLSTAMIAVQGPRALATAQPLTDAPLESFDYYSGAITTICGVKGIASRTGYTGEDGCELIVPAGSAVEVWQKLLALGAPVGARPAGLGARDTLRLEAAMPLYGHELSEEINPFQAGLRFAVQLQHDFSGRDALAKIKDTPQPVRIGLELTGKRVPREHCKVVADGEAIGEVTSGTFSPTLEKPIAMAYVRPGSERSESELAIDIRGKPEAARIVPLPFYKRK